MKAAPVTLAELRTIDLFDDLDDAELAPWAAVTQTYDVPVDTVILAGQSQTPRGLQLAVHRPCAHGAGRQRA